jgi:hypothetical protein
VDTPLTPFVIFFGAWPLIPSFRLENDSLLCLNCLSLWPNQHYLKGNELPDINNTLAAIQQLANVHEYPLAQPQYELLEEFFETPRSERDAIWKRIKEHEDLLLLFEMLAVPLLGGEIQIQDVPKLKRMISEILAHSKSEQLVSKCRDLANCLKREGL